ncbi:MAG TPA: hypothetical protein VFW39_09770 [Sphingomicrobium sp.]|nr:hypothetical protein [Sphingomicrobium sp.]
MGAIFFALFLVPAVALGWRVVVSKTHNWPLRIGAAAAAMTTIVGAAVIYDNLESFEFKDWRSDLALAAAVSGSIYLLVWARRRGNRRHRTISIIAAIVGLIPAVATVATTLLYRVDQ